MEKIYTFSTVKTLAKTYGLLTSFLLLAIFLLLLVRLNAESSNYGIYYGDEYHTIHQGLNLLINGKVDNFRSQEGVRLLVRAFYPYALVYMNTHMGGNVYLEGWSYPGHNYVTKHFVNSSDPSADFSKDPNLRDLFHALREPYIALVFACILFLLLFFFREKYYLVAFGGVLLLGFDLDFLNEQKLFYVEPGMLASLALVILAYCHCLYQKVAPQWVSILFGFLAAFMVSTKFSTVLFTALPIILFFYLLPRKDALQRIVLYMISLAAFYAFINFPAFVSLESFNLFLHDLSSNFWHYSAGSDSSITVAPGIPHLGLIVHQLEALLGYALYIMPPIMLFAIYHANAREKMILVPILALTLLSIHSLASQQIYLHRNLVPFYLPIAIISLFSIEIITRRFIASYNKKHVFGWVFAIITLWLSGVIVHAGGITQFTSALLPSSKNSFVSELQAVESRSGSQDKWYAVGFSEYFFDGESFSNRIIPMDDVPMVLNEKKYPDLIERFSTLPTGSTVLVNRIGNNKHLTNYILPKYFAENRQFGEYYVFFNL